MILMGRVVSLGRQAYNLGFQTFKLSTSFIQDNDSNMSVSSWRLQFTLYFKLGPLKVFVFFLDAFDFSVRGAVT